ncbi:adhesin, partial [Paraburkholderia aspalathi]
TVNNITNGNAGVMYFHVNSTLADSSATGTDAMAIGPNAKATASNSVALGANSVASRANTVDVGSRQITDVAAGTQPTDAVNVGQLQALGANVDSSGNITNAFVAYDNTTKN